MTTPSDTHEPVRGRLWLLFPLLLAGACVWAAVAIGTDQWTDWFLHPARIPEPATTREGASLFRLMLPVAAVALVLGGVIFHTLDPGRVRRRDRPTGTPGETLLILVTMTLALVARLPRLTESLWYDELASYISYGSQGPGPIVANYFDPSNHILQTLLSWASVRWMTPLVGDDAIALRLPALVFSVLTVLAMYLCVRRVAEARVAAVAALLVAILPVSVLSGVEARGYAIMIFFAAASTAALLGAIERRSGWRWMVYAILAALGVWAHVVTMFVFAGHACVLVAMLARRDARRAALAGLCAVILAAVLAALLYAPALPDLLAQRETFAAMDGDEPSPFGIEGRHLLLQLGGSWTWWASIPTGAVACIGLVAGLRREPTRWLIVASLLGLPLFVATVIALDSWLYARFALFALPGTIVLAALGVDALWQRRRLVGLMALMTVCLASAMDVLTLPPKQPLRDAAMVVHDRAEPGDTVLVVGLAHRVMAYYRGDVRFAYSLHHGERLPRELELVDPTWIIVMYPGHVSP
ncbi:MAG: glycosyltransferase family 39 protein, partial [Phycisphaerales bacterium]|nr:glycosyltransferase family 39 protein [Phycisphaerales bacterium]